MVIFRPFPQTRRPQHEFPTGLRTPGKKEMPRLVSLTIDHQAITRKSHISLPGNSFQTCHIATAQQWLIQKLNARCLETNPAHGG
jgi:hypothetical protein